MDNGQSSKENFDFPEIDSVMDNFIHEMFREALRKSQFALDNEEPNPDYLLEQLSAGMNTYLQKHPKESDQYYLLLFNNCISLILKNLQNNINIYDETVLTRCLNAPQSRNYLATHPGMQYSVDFVREKINEKKSASLTSVQQGINLPPINTKKMEKTSSIKKLSPRSFKGFFSASTLSPSKESEVSIAFKTWNEGNPVKTNKTVDNYKKLLQQHRETFFQMGISYEFLDELALQLPNLSIHILQIQKIPTFFEKKLDKNSKIWNDSLLWIKQYKELEGTINKFISLIDNLIALFIDKKILLNDAEKEKLLTTLNQMGACSKNFRTNEKEYKNYMQIINHIKIKDYEQFDHTKEKLFDYFVFELNRSVQFYMGKKDSVKLGLRGLKGFELDLPKNLLLISNTYNLEISPLFDLIDNRITENSDEVLSPVFKNIYSGIRSTIKHMNQECQEYLVEANKKKIKLINDDKPQVHSDQMQNKIKYHQASYALSHQLIHFEKEKKKFNMIIKKEFQLVLNSTNKILAKVEENLSGTKRQSSEPKPSAPMMVYQHRKLNSDTTDNRQVSFFAQLNESTQKKESISGIKQNHAQSVSDLKKINNT